MKKRRRKKSGIGRKVVEGLLAALILALIAVPPAYEYVTRNDPFTAVVMSACGINVGAVVTLRSGEQVFLRHNDPRLAEALKEIPDERKGQLTAGGPYCVTAQPRVF